MQFKGWSKYEGVSWVKDEEGRHLHISEVLKPTTWNNVPAEGEQKVYDFYFDQLANDKPVEVRERVLKYLYELGFDEPIEVEARRDTVKVTASKKEKRTMRVRVRMRAPVSTRSMF